MPEKTTPLPSIKDVPASVWEKLAQKKIYFGHQSVGYNIIDGIKDLMKEYPQIRLNIVETTDPADFKAGIFAHSRVGKNTDPKSKVNEFVKFVENGIGNKADIAFFKLCYIDITELTGIKEVFKNYKSSLAQLKKKNPKTIFIHLTTPLTRRQTGIKTWIKNIIGRPIGGVDDNIKRNELNELLRNEYSGKEPIFDLAAVESTYPDGTKMSFEKEGKTIYALVPEYTYDGGHLNEKGRKIVAEQLLLLLANLK